MKIVVLGGGISSERKLSLETSAAILKSLRKQGHNVVFVDPFIGIERADVSQFGSEDGLSDDLQKSRELSWGK